MKKEFYYISEASSVFFVLTLIFMPFALLALGCTLFAFEDTQYTWIGGIFFLIWLILVGLYYFFRYLKADFQADDKAFTFQFKKKKLHFCYDEIAECELMNYPEHSRFGSLVGYKIHLHITDKQQNEHVIRQYISVDYSFLDYPQGLPEEVQKAELTEIGNFIKSKLVPVQPEQKTDTSSIYSNIADIVLR